MKPFVDLPEDHEQLKNVCLEQSLLLKQNTAALQEKNTTIQDQEKQIKILEEYILYLKHQKFGTSSERHIDQLSLLDESECIADEVVESQDEPPTEDDGQENEPDDNTNNPKKRGRRKLSENLPRIKRYHELAENQQQCDCGCQMEAFDEVTSEQLGIIPAKLYVIQHCRKKYRCKQCEGAIKLAPLPPQPIPKSNASPELLAYSIVAKFLDGLPFYRQEKIWERMDVSLSRATLANWAIKSGGGLVQPLINLLIEHQMSGDYLNIDETTIKVLKEPDKPPDGKKYFWVTVGGSDEKPVYRFHYNPSRGTQAAKALLDDFKGTVMSDDWHIYERACEALSLQHITCNDHARRKFKEAKIVEPKNKNKKQNTPSRPGIALIFYKKLYAIEKRIKLMALASADDIRTIRQTESLPIWEAFKTWIEKTIPHINPASKLGKALNYTYRLWPKLTAYCDDGRLPMSNERAENAIRPFAIARKNFLFFDSPQGAKASENHYSLIMTAKMNGLDPFYYMAHVLKNLPSAETLEDVEGLLPWNLDNEMLKASFDINKGVV